MVFSTREEGWSVTVDFSAKAGETYTLTMHGPDGDDYVHSGTFREVVPGRRLVFSWNSRSVEDTLVTIELTELERDGGTELVLTHNFMPDADVEGHKKGWLELMEHLNNLLTS